MSAIPILQVPASPVSVLITISFILIIGYIAREIFRKTKIPEVLILILIGLVLVPIGHVLPSDYVVTLRSLAQLFGAIALITIMYGGGKKIGLTSSFMNFKGMSLGILDVLVPAVLVAYAMNLLLGWPLIYGGLLGIMFGATASAIVIPIIRGLKMPSEIYEMLIVETALSSVVSIVLFTVMLSMLAGHVFSIQSFVEYVVDYLSVAVFVGILAGFLWLVALSRIKAADEYLAKLAIAILVYGIVSLLNGAAIVSVLIFAMMMGNYRPISKLIKLNIRISRNTARQEIEVGSALEFLIRTFFFVFIGMIALLSYSYLEYALIVTVLLVLARFVEVKLALWKSKQYQTLTFSMMQRGTVVAVLATLLYSMGGSYFNQIFYISFMVIIATNIIGSILVSRVKFEVKPD